jgi:uncharacterized OB-fold protein
MIAVARCDTTGGSAGLAKDYNSWLEAESRVLVQRCDSCELAQFPPMLRCRACQSDRLSWIDGGSTGTLATWVTVFGSEQTPGYAVPKWLLTSLPYASAFVLLDLIPNVRVPALMLECNEELLRPDVGVSLRVRTGAQPVYLASLS